ncbi:hypothetical protein HanIR_Chr09g0442691 [Helianthus annuus]|nr:hypothetical protein HanIR_Chr09g0442691 [Helianthus annuus]
MEETSFPERSHGNIVILFKSQYSSLLITRSPHFSSFPAFSPPPLSSLEIEACFHLHHILSIKYIRYKHITVAENTIATTIPAAAVFDSCFFSCRVDSRHDVSGGPHRLSLYMNEFGGNLEKVVGISPSRWLFERLRAWRLVNLPSASGTSPLSSLDDKFNLSNFTRFDRDTGISPVREFLLRSRITWSSVRVPSSDGIDPVNEFSDRRNSNSFLHPPSVRGIAPERLFL